MQTLLGFMSTPALTDSKFHQPHHLTHFAFFLFEVNLMACSRKSLFWESQRVVSVSFYVGDVICMLKFGKSESSIFLFHLFSEHDFQGCCSICTLADFTVFGEKCD